LGTLDTFAISWLLTGRVEIAGSIAGLEIVTKIAWYYLHERVWAAIPWAGVPFNVHPGGAQHPRQMLRRLLLSLSFSLPIWSNGFDFSLSMVSGFRFAASSLAWRS
jgi:uncharacterized membrane protein